MNMIMLLNDLCYVIKWKWRMINVFNNGKLPFYLASRIRNPDEVTLAVLPDPMAAFCTITGLLAICRAPMVLYVS